MFDKIARQREFDPQDPQWKEITNGYMSKIIHTNYNKTIKKELAVWLVVIFLEVTIKLTINSAFNKNARQSEGKQEVFR